MAAPDDVARLVATVFEVAGALRQIGEHEAASAGQTQSRWQMMSVVSEGDWTVPRAAKRLGIQRQSAQRTVDALHADGLVELHDNPYHARSRLVRLTSAGRDALGRINEVADRWHVEVAKTMTRTEVATTRRTLEALRDAAATDPQRGLTRRAARDTDR